MNAPLTLPAIDAIRAHEDEMIAVRRQIHEQPELAYEEHATADLVAEFRPAAPIVAVTPTEVIAQRLALQWGVIPVCAAMPSNPNDALHAAEAIARGVLEARDGDTVAIVVGSQKHSGNKSFVLDTLGR